MECVNTDHFSVPQTKRGLSEPSCTLVTQLLNPVRPKWLRPSRHLNLAAPHPGCLRPHCTHHMVVVSLSPHIRICGNLPKVVGASTGVDHSVSPADREIFILVRFLTAFFAFKVNNWHDFRGFFWAFRSPLL